MTTRFATAAEHARHASALLAGLAALADRLEAMTPDEHLEASVAGSFPRLNADMRWTAELAIAHALTAIARTLITEDGLTVDDG